MHSLLRLASWLRWLASRIYSHPKADRLQQVGEAELRCSRTPDEWRLHHADPNGMMLNGWPQQLDVVVATHGATPLAERLPKIMWRGRAEDEPRDEVRRVMVNRCWSSHMCVHRLQVSTAPAISAKCMARQRGMPAVAVGAMTADRCCCGSPDRLSAPVSVAHTRAANAQAALQGLP